DDACANQAELSAQGTFIQSTHFAPWFFQVQMNRGGSSGSKAMASRTIHVQPGPGSGRDRGSDVVWVNQGGQVIGHVADVEQTCVLEPGQLRGRRCEAVF